MYNVICDIDHGHIQFESYNKKVAPGSSLQSLLLSVQCFTATTTKKTMRKKNPKPYSNLYVYEERKKKKRTKNGWGRFVV